LLDAPEYDAHRQQAQSNSMRISDSIRVSHNHRSLESVGVLQ